MATYAIGDIQGCYHAFMALLARLNFHPKQDQLWLVGDIVNRGSGSLEVLRWCYQNQASIKVVLGNHDLHALAVLHELKPEHKSDTLQAIFHAPDRAALMIWLRNQPLMIVENGFVMLHAGLLPQWTITQAQSLASEVETVLKSDNYQDFLKNMYGSLPAIWSDNLKGMDRLRIITNAFTRMRVCTIDGEMEFAFKGELPDIPAGHLPWFDVPNRQSQDAQIVCGHWSALGLQQRSNVHALDTGCLWGGKLTAMNLETRTITQVNHDPLDVVVRNI